MIISSSDLVLRLGYGRSSRLFARKLGILAALYAIGVVTPTWMERHWRMRGLPSDGPGISASAREPGTPRIEIPRLHLVSVASLTCRIKVKLMIPPEYFEVNGARIPSRGLGTFQPDPKKYGPDSVKRSVLAALRAGYRHIDTSLRYGDGQGEREIGDAIRESGIPREEVFIVSKLENVYHAPEDVEVNIDISLKNLGFDYIDLFIMHFPYAYKKTKDYGTERDAQGRPAIDVELSRSFDVTWKAMERLVDIGKAKFIGLSNFSSPKVKRLLQTARIKPICNQVECHPYFPQKGLVELCNQNNIHVTAFGPLGCVPIPALVGRTGPGPLEDRSIAMIAEKHSRTPAQVILCHLLCRGISVIPKSNTEKRIIENFDCIFDLSEDDFRHIDELMGPNGERGIRNFNSLEYLGFDNYNEEFEEP